MSDGDSTLDTCGACAGTAASTPRAVVNRPGLRAIAYRVGTHPDVLASLRAALTDARRPALAGLRTRESDDFTLALLDAFACMTDVLSFYQERIANESFIRTATERRSVLELARLLGYELRPGVAASTYLAFRLEQGQGAPERAPIPSGTRVQSLPGPGEVPQTFETVEAIADAAGEWNELRARTQRKQSLGVTATAFYAQGVATNVQPGDPLLFIRSNGSSSQHALRVAIKVELDPVNARTRIEWEGQVGFAPAEVHVLRQRAALFGHNAPDWRAMPKNVQHAYLGLPANVDPPTVDEWPGFTVAAVAAGRGLLQECHNGQSQSDLRAKRIDLRMEIIHGFDPPVPGVANQNFSARWTGYLTPPASGSYVLHTRSDDGSLLRIDGALAVDNRGDHATREASSAAIALQAGRRYAITIDYHNNLGEAFFDVSWTTPAGVKHRIPNTMLMPYDLGNTLQLDASYPKIAPGSWVVLSEGNDMRAYQVASADEDSRAGFTISSKTTRVVLESADLAGFDDKLRTTVVFAQSQALTPAEEPDPTLVAQYIDLERSLRLLPEPGRPVLVAGTAVDPATSAQTARVERALIKKVVDDDSGLQVRSRLLFEPPLGASYVRDSVRVYGNVAFATHGESVAPDTVGSGDATQAHQHFALHSSPVTYTPAANPSGGDSTLSVRVDGVEWTRVPMLFGAGPSERVYQERLSDDGQTTIEFGDGVMGARLPTGVENVVARYRKGLGAAGNLPAGRLTLLAQRPHGVKEVLNPGAAEGGQDAQTLADARANVPRSAITLERIVSLRDYEDFALNFAGIGKARASITVRGEALGVLLSVAGANGETISNTGKLRADLLEAIAAAGDRAVHVDARSFRPAWFELRCGVAVRPEYEPTAVLARVREALLASFSFAQRDLGQPVAESQVIAVIQAVPGVVMVDIDRFAREDGATIAGRPGYLPSAVPAPYSDAGVAQAAELLLLRAIDLRVIA